jgi:hypothetical protein
MRDDQYEPNRFLGFPVRTGPQPRKDENPQARENEEPLARKDGKPRARRVEEPQRMMGFPVDGLSSADWPWLDTLAHPVREYRRWRRRRLGPFAADEDEPRARR